jgi:hypothetical protein
MLDKAAANVQVLLQMWYLITVSPVPDWLCFVDEFKNLCWALFIELELLLIVAHR